MRAGSLVVGDRWGYGYYAQPEALRFYGPEWLAEWAVRLLPKPELLVNLSAPSDVIALRKQELTLAELEAELRRWVSLPRENVFSVDASLDAATTAEVVYYRLFPEYR